MSDRPPTPVQIGPFPSQETADYFLSSFEQSVSVVLEDPERFTERIEDVPVEIVTDPAIEGQVREISNGNPADDGHYISLVFASHVNGPQINGAISVAAEATYRRYPDLDIERVQVKAYLENVTDYADRSIL